MIWIKRITPFIIILAGWYGYNYYTIYQYDKVREEQNRYALITAQVWVASVKYRNEPDRYIEYRDSLLLTENLSADSIKLYIEQFKDRAEWLGPLANQIKEYIDSLIIVEDSLKAVEDSLALADSLTEVDSL